MTLFYSQAWIVPCNQHWCQCFKKQKSSHFIEPPFECHELFEWPFTAKLLWQLSSFWFKFKIINSCKIGPKRLIWYLWVQFFSGVKPLQIAKKYAFFTRKVIDLKCGVLECRKHIARNFLLESNLVSKTVSSNLISKTSGSNLNTIKRAFCWELKSSQHPMLET